jgi:peptide/nickel transport system permease protein
VLLAVLAPLFGDPYATPVDGLTREGLPLGILSPGHPLGTDSLGRDMLARVAYGARASLAIAFISNITSVGLGVVVGLVAGFYRGWVEQLLMRITDVFLAVPTVISGLALASVLGTGVLGIATVVTPCTGPGRRESCSARRWRSGGARSSRRPSRWARPAAP